MWVWAVFRSRVQCYCQPSAIFRAKCFIGQPINILFSHLCWPVLKNMYMWHKVRYNDNRMNQIKCTALKTKLAIVSLIRSYTESCMCKLLCCIKRFWLWRFICTNQAAMKRAKNSASMEKKMKVTHVTLEKWNCKFDKDCKTVMLLECESSMEAGTKVVRKIKCGVCTKFWSSILHKRNFSDK